MDAEEDNLIKITAILAFPFHFISPGSSSLSHRPRAISTISATVGEVGSTHSCYAGGSDSSFPTSVDLSFFLPLSPRTYVVVSQNVDQDPTDIEK